MARATRGRGKSNGTVKDMRKGAAIDDDFGKNEHFQPSGEALHEFLSNVIDEEDAAIAAIMDAARKKCQAHRKAINAAKKRMVKDGYHTKELDVIIRKRRLERKVENVAKDLDIDQAEHYLDCLRALNKHRGLPLVDAAISAAEAAVGVH